MIIHKIHDLSNEYVTNLLINEFDNILDSRIVDNYSSQKKDKSSNLFYILKNGRYKNGAYFVIEDGGKYIASAGWNQYTDDTALVLSRAFVTPEFRTSYIMAELLLPKMLIDCSAFRYVWITCNKYNKAIYNWFERKSLGKRTALFNDWPEIYNQFIPIGLKVVYNTEQYVVQLKDDYDNYP